MRQDSFPTFRRIGRWFLKTLRIPALQKTCLAVVGFWLALYYKWQLEFYGGGP